MVWFGERRMPSYISRENHSLLLGHARKASDLFSQTIFLFQIKQQSKQDGARIYIIDPAPLSPFPPAHSQKVKVKFAVCSLPFIFLGKILKILKNV